jgi:iron complex transport system permease protein
MNKNKILNIIFYTSLLILACSLLLQVGIGSFSMSFSKIIESVFNYDLIFNSSYFIRRIFGENICNALNISPINELVLTKESLIIWDIRIPRFLLGLLAGINLSISGVIFQTITRNEMASPYILGISQGSGLSIILILMLFPFLYNFIPILAIIGGILAFVLIYLIAWNHGTSPMRLVLAGIIIGSIASAIQGMLFLFASDLSLIQNVMSWTSGSLIGTSWDEVRLLLPYTCFTLILACLCKKQLNLLLLGEYNAKSIGFSVERWRFILAFIGILAAASSVSVCGLIGFVGLISPHISRMLIGSDCKYLIPCCVIIGATLLVVSDTLARVIFNPIQVPVGIIMSVVGGIFFIFLMIKNKRINRI